MAQAIDAKKNNIDKLNPLVTKWLARTHTQTHTHTHTQTCQPYQRDSNFVKYYRFQNVCGERVCCVRLLFNIILDELFNMIEVVPKNKYVPIIYIHRRTHALTRTHTDSYSTV